MIAAVITSVRNVGTSPRRPLFPHGCPRWAAVPLPMRHVRLGACERARPLALPATQRVPVAIRPPDPLQVMFDAESMHRLMALVCRDKRTLDNCLSIPKPCASDLSHMYASFWGRVPFGRGNAPAGGSGGKAPPDAAPRRRHAFIMQRPHTMHRFMAPLCSNRDLCRLPNSARKHARLTQGCMIAMLWSSKGQCPMLGGPMARWAGCTGSRRI
jgi:hypothetical protein